MQFISVIFREQPKFWRVGAPQKREEAVDAVSVSVALNIRLLVTKSE
jgi:hypothetical protein